MALTTPYMFQYQHFLQEDRIFVSLASRVGSIGASAVAAWLLPRLGAKMAFFLGTVIGGLPNLAFIWMPGQSGAYAAPLLIAVGAAIAQPARIMFLAAALRTEELTRAQAALAVLANVTKAPAGPFFTAMFFGSRAAMDQGFILSAALVLVSSLSIFWLPSEPPASREREAQQQEEEAEEAQETERLL